MREREREREREVNEFGVVDRMVMMALLLVVGRVCKAGGGAQIKIPSHS